MDIELCLELLQNPNTGLEVLQKPNNDLDPLIIVTAILLAHKLQSLGYKDIEVTPFIDEKLVNIECRTPSATFEVDINGVGVYEGCLTKLPDIPDSLSGHLFRHYDWSEFMEVLDSKSENKYLELDLCIDLLEHPINDIPPLLIMVSFLLARKLETLGYRDIEIIPFHDEQIIQISSEEPTDTIEVAMKGINVFRTNPNPNDPDISFDYKFREYSWLEIITILNSDTPTL